MTFGHLTRRHLFNELLQERNLWDSAERQALWIPAVDVEETEKNYIFRAETPGLKKEDVKISVKDNVLTLSGEKKSEERQESSTYHRVERGYGSFQRTYSITKPIQADQISANYKDGLLEIVVPKAEEIKPKEIEIKVN
jgi:HSP20 family protein